MKQIFYKLFENLKQLGIKPSIGSRTNVTPIPGSEIDRIINRPVAPKEFDYSKPEVVDSIRGIVKNASDYVGQFTERQAKTFNDNIERILNVIKPKETTADVVDLATKEKITGPGLESLMKEKGVPSISRKTIEAETLIKQFLDDDLISLNAKQIDQLSRGKAEDVFENIFGSKAKELITGKNTNESLNEVYKKLKTTKDVKGRLPDDPSFDPSDIEFKEGGSVSEDVRQLLKEEFIKIINEDPEAYPDTNAGFRRFLKRKGAPVFNYKDGGEVEEKEEKDILEKIGTLYKRKKEKKDGKLGPTDPLSKYESYSEEELAGNIEAKKPTFDTLEDYIMETMPIFEPKDVAPSKSYSPMPVLPGLNAPGFGPPVDLKDGGPSDPSKRKFIKGAGIVGAVGLASKFIPDLFQTAKKATKVVPKKASFVNIVKPFGATETKFPEWFPSLVSRLRKEGDTKPIYATEEIPLTKEEYLKLKEKGTDRIYDRYTGFTEKYVNELKKEGIPQHYQIKDTDEIIGYEYIDKNLPDVKAVEYGGQEMNVYFKNNYGQSVEIQYVSPGTKTKEGQFAVADARPEPGSYYDSAPDFEQVYVTDIDEVLGGSGKVEQYATKAKTPRYTKGAAEVDEAEGRALSEIDRLKDEGLIDD